MNFILLDLKYAVRRLQSAPTFTIVASTVLGVSIAAATLAFSLLDQAVLRHLPVRAPEELYVLRSFGPDYGMVRDSERGLSFSYPKYQDFKVLLSSFGELITHFPAAATIVIHSQAEPVNVSVISGNFFDVLGVVPAAGRLIGRGDDLRPMSHPVVVLSHQFWSKSFNSNMSAIGSVIHLNNVAFTIIGVSRPDFHGIERGDTRDVWIPMMMKDVVTPTWPGLDRRDWAWLKIVMRLKHDVLLETVQAKLSVGYKQILSAEIALLPSGQAGNLNRFLSRTIELVPIRDYVATEHVHLARAITAIMGLVALVLCIAILNLSGLNIARTVARERELGIRAALGASRLRLVLSVAMENVLVAVLGGSIGLILAALLSASLIQTVLKSEQANYYDSEINLRIVVFAAILTGASALFLGLTPLLRLTYATLVPALKAESGGTAGGQQVRLRKLLVAMQIALCLGLIVCAGLLAQTLYNLRHLDLGFNKENLITFTIDPLLSGYIPDKAVVTLRRVEEEIKRQIPGVLAIGSADYAVLKEESNSMQYQLPGRTITEQSLSFARELAVTPGFRPALGLRLLAGRDFTWNDLDHKGNILVNQSFAKRFFGRPDVLNNTVSYLSSPKTVLNIVGIVGDQRQESLLEASQPIVYIPKIYPASRTYYLRQLSNVPLDKLQAIVQNVAPDVPVQNLAFMRQVVDGALHEERIMAQIAVAFGLLAALLAAIGIYGLLAYTIERRTKEFGLRRALGATNVDLGLTIARDVGAMVLCGIGGGVSLAVLSARVLQGHLYGVRPYDPIIFLAAITALLMVAIVATAVPMYGAIKLDPSQALRST